MTDVKHSPWLPALGKSIKQAREKLGISQVTLAERAAISYQYLSGLENGRENLSVSVLDSVCLALGIELDQMVCRGKKYLNTPKNFNVAERPGIEKSNFREVPLPKGLTNAEIYLALKETELAISALNDSMITQYGFSLSSLIQKNNFSGIVSNLITKFIDSGTSFKSNTETKYPDLIDPSSKIGLEIKSTMNIGKGGESHNGHDGWHLLCCFELLNCGNIKFVHIMAADLIGHLGKDADWKYCGSKVKKTTGSQRTETYTTNSRGTAKLRHGSVYIDPSVDYSRWRVDKSLPLPQYSIFSR